MDLAGKYDIPAKREVVWEALNNPEILKKSIKGCEYLEKSSENVFSAKVKAKIGPVSATFSGLVTISDISPPNTYTISGEGKGGAAGFAKGSVKVNLTEVTSSNHTTLSYEGSAQVGGKLAQLGSRLVGGIVKKTADDFFISFCSLVSQDPSKNNQSSSLNTTEDNKIERKYYLPYWYWIFGIIAIIGLILLFIN